MSPSEIPLQVPTSAPQIPVVNEQNATTTEQAEIGGRIGPEPTRFGDWERDGRCIDF